ncbi:hypothetical protein ABT010_17080 [Streptomyces sp. NPDC002668]|uniref:hypothetical protein n=1 Tax=Streptomyces sp. NPDC002668 TaxID=3154422 RepID=UPI0033347D4E
MVKGVGAGVLSMATGMRMLIDAGYTIDDAQAEIERIQARSFDAAARLADATGDNAAVRAYLGLPEADRDVPGAPPIAAIAHDE